MTVTSKEVILRLLERSETQALCDPRICSEMKTLLESSGEEWFTPWNNKRELVFDSPSAETLRQHCPKLYISREAERFVALKHVAKHIIWALEVTDVEEESGFKDLKDDLELLSGQSSGYDRARLVSRIKGIKREFPYSKNDLDTADSMNIFSRDACGVDVIFRASADNKNYIQWLAPLESHENNVRCAACNNGPLWKCALNVINRHGLSHVSAEKENLLEMVLEFHSVGGDKMHTPNAFVSKQGTSEEEFKHNHRFFSPEHLSAHNLDPCGITFNLSGDQSYSVPEWITIDNLVVGNIWLVLKPSIDLCVEPTHDSLLHWPLYVSELDL